MEQTKWLNEDYWVSEFNWLPEVRNAMELPEKVWVHECTLRESEQAVGIVLKPDEKIALAKAIDRLGVSSIEIFPVVSQQDKEVTVELIRMNLRAQIRCLSRWLIQDIDVVLECGAKAIEIENTSNPWINNVAYGLSEDQIVTNFVKATRYAKDNGLNVTVVPWDTYRCPLPLLERLFKAIVFEGGADRVAVADTSGVGLPSVTSHMIKTVRGWIPGVPVEMHAHNDTGLATAIMLSAVMAGASGVHTVLCGYGTRGGNAPTEEVIVNLEMLLGVDTGADLSQIHYVCKLAQDLTKIPVPANKPIIGDNLYTYLVGLSVDVFHKINAAGRPHGYVPIRPSLIGRPGYRIVMGKMTGKAAVRNKLQEMGIEFSSDQLTEITDRVKQEGILRKGIVDDDVFIKIAHEVCDSIKKDS
jgi:2-isopropylmalate synthase